MAKFATRSFDVTVLSLAEARLFREVVMLRALLLTALLDVLSMQNAESMEFKILNFPSGELFVWATGEIVDGDASRLTQSLDLVGTLEDGTKVVGLDSPGGNVTEAMLMSRVLRHTPTSTIVPPGAECASACAMILYLSGKYRSVIEGGLLGLHSCSLGGQASAECNEDIAQHALELGTPFGSIKAFLDYAPPSEMIWFGRSEARCWGLLFEPGDSVDAVYFPPCVLDGIAGSSKRP